jgi:preprotein translocase subunit SecE
VAERKRRGEEPADEHLDEALFDDTADDDDVEEPDDIDVDDDDVEDEKVTSVARSGRRGGTATKERAKADRPVKKESSGVRVFGRIGRFVREVVAELRKVIWPTRKELITYASVVVVFVTVMLSILFVLDQAFARLVLWVFGNPSN